MAEKGETKILAIITICIILVSIMFSGCFDNNDDNYNNENNKNNYAKASDLRLILEIDNQSLKNGINLTIKLKNISNHSIKIDRHFRLDRNFLDLYLIGPNNESLNIFYGQTDREIKYIIFESNQYLEYNISLKRKSISHKIINQDGTYEKQSWDWNTKGCYTIFATYHVFSSGIKIKSNIIEFNIE